MSGWDGKSDVGRKERGTRAECEGREGGTDGPGVTELRERETRDVGYVSSGTSLGGFLGHSYQGPGTSSTPDGTSPDSSNGGRHNVRPTTKTRGGTHRWRPRLDPTWTRVHSQTPPGCTYVRRSRRSVLPRPRNLETGPLGRRPKSKGGRKRVQTCLYGHSYGRILCPLSTFPSRLHSLPPFPVTSTLSLLTS